MCPVAHLRVVTQHAAQEALALLERHVGQHPPIEVDQVEDVVDDGRDEVVVALPGLVRVGRPRPEAPHAGAVLEQAEGRAAFAVESDHLAVENRRLGLDPRRLRSGEVGEVARGVLLVACPEPDLAVVDDRLDTVPVELQLEQPIGIVERRVAHGRLHRLDEVGEGRDLRAGQVDVGFLCRRARIPHRVLAGEHLVVGSAGLDRLRQLVDVPVGIGRLVALVDQQPVVRAGLGAARLDQREAAAQLLAVEPELELALADGPARIVGFLRLERAPVPHDHVAAAVLALGNDALEVEVRDRMVLDMNGHAPLVGVERRPARHGPAHQHAVDLEPEVVVQPTRSMALNDEPPAFRRRRGRADIAGRLRCLLEVALAAIRLERHASIRLRRRRRRVRRLPSRAARPA